MPTEPETLVVTHIFEPRNAVARLRLRGHRLGGGLTGGGRSHFVQDETIGDLTPGTGPVSVTTWVYDLAPGEWAVDAELVGGVTGAARREAVRRGQWSWRRWAVSPTGPVPVRTRWALLAPLAGQPAVTPGVYTLLAVVGFGAALAFQAALVGRPGTPVPSVLIASLIAIGMGLIGAKAWYSVLRPDESIIRGGWAVDGFVVVMPLAALAAYHAFDLPVGHALDALAPGLFVAVAVGRVGCFLTGCCAGRPTVSRWGIWSSDRRIGTRRVPAQLLEAGVGLVLAGLALAVVLIVDPAVGGLVFTAAVATYASARQVLLRLRAERRRSPRTIPLTAWASAASMVVVAAVAVTHGH